MRSRAGLCDDDRRTLRILDGNQKYLGRSRYRQDAQDGGQHDKTDVLVLGARTGAAKGPGASTRRTHFHQSSVPQRPRIQETTSLLKRQSPNDRRAPSLFTFSGQRTTQLGGSLATGKATATGPRAGSGDPSRRTKGTQFGRMGCMASSNIGGPQARYVRFCRLTQAVHGVSQSMVRNGALRAGVR
ncbi:hypothetical protein DENSPDRAFT_401699 [Dentipellis sp. KUC8613]|nr:hypothetical protein DENSPDRAFT_401699 [Dentipellis sp. KUC8613]